MIKKLLKPDGEWLPVHQEINGKTLLPKDFIIPRLMINGSTYTVLSEKPDEGIIRVKGRNLDIYSTDGTNNGRHLTAIYQIENSKLTICYNLKGNVYPQAFYTAHHPAYFLSVFKKI
jgi:uncharacterized protein (TIGR03067 family)